MAGDPPLPSIDANSLAQLLGVTPKEVYDLTKAGVFERGTGRVFSVEDSVRRYCEWLRKQRARTEAMRLTGLSG